MTNLSKLRYQTIEIFRLKLNNKIRHVTYFVKSFQVTSLSRGKLFMKDLPRNFSLMSSFNYILIDIFDVLQVLLMQNFV